MTDTPPKNRGFIRGRYYSPLDRRTRKIAFLAAIAEGNSVADASERVDVPAHTLFSWRRTDPPFRKAWHLARAHARLPEQNYPVPAPPPLPQAVVTLHKFELPEDDGNA